MTQFCAGSRPGPCGKTCAQPPVGKSEQIIRHGDVEPTPLPGGIPATQRQQNVDYGRKRATANICG